MRIPERTLPLTCKRMRQRFLRIMPSPFFRASFENVALASARNFEPIRPFESDRRHFGYDGREESPIDGMRFTGTDPRTSD